ncbi:MAG: hypothetical protein ACODAE_08380 [Gemmatimonadota bacterium]
MTGDVVCIVGGAPSYRQAPYGDPGARIWGLGMHWTYLPRVDRVFEMHDRSIWSDYLGQDPGRYAARLASADVPVVMREAHPDVPRSEAFPFDAVEARFGDVAAEPGPALYGSSFDYMLAYALTRDPLPAELRLYGIHMDEGREYAHQRPSASYWIGLARGMGVPVWIHPDAADLCRTPNPYGSRAWFGAGADDAPRRRHVETAA